MGERQRLGGVGKRKLENRRSRMLEFRVENTSAFSSANYLLYSVCEIANLKCSPELFSVTVSRPAVLPFVIALEIMPEFFTHYLCDQFHHFAISIDPFFMAVYNMHTHGYTSLSLSLALAEPELFVSYIQFWGSPTGRVQDLSLELWPPAQHEDIAEIDYGTFVTMNIKAFRRVLSELYDSQDFLSYVTASVTITNSQVTFNIGSKTIILTKEENQCLIGGVEAGEEIQSSVTFYPMEFFYNFFSKKVWLFKAKDSNSIIITAPLGLHLQILAYFPQRV